MYYSYPAKSCQTPEYFSQLKRAIQMRLVGCSPEEVFNATGLQRMPDGSHVIARFPKVVFGTREEIDRAKFTEDGGLQDVLAANEGWKSRLKSGEFQFLQDLIDHDSFFEEFPNSRYISVRTETFGDNDSSDAYFDGKMNEIVFSERFMNECDDESFLSVMTHELAHYSQRISNRANGWSPSPEAKAKFVRYLEQLSERKESEINLLSYRLREHTAALANANNRLKQAKLFQSYSKLVDYANCDSPTRVSKHIYGHLTWMYDESFMEGSGLAKDTRDVYELSRSVPRSNYKRKKTNALRELSLCGAQLIKSRIDPALFREFKSADCDISSVIRAERTKCSNARKALEPMSSMKDEMRALRDFSNDIGLESSYEVYRRFFGEIDAFNVQKITMDGSGLLHPSQLAQDCKTPPSKHIVVVNGRLINFDDRLVGVGDLDRLVTQMSDSGVHFAKIVLNPMSDVCDVVHESAHWHLEMLSDLNLHKGVKGGIKDDFTAVLQWMGVSQKDWYSMPPEDREPYCERFAEAFEGYLRTTDSPLGKVFGKIKAWLGEIYKALSAEKLVSGNALDGLFYKMTRTSTKSSGFAEAAYAVINDEMGVDVAKACKVMHDATLNYFSKRSGLAAEYLVKNFSLAIERESSQATPQPEPASPVKMKLNR